MANKKAVSAQMDAIALLMDEHKRVRVCLRSLKNSKTRLKASSII